MLAGFCKHAVWLFGVLVGLAIKEAITRVVPHLLILSDGNRTLGIEALRLLIFGLMIVRHYLGAAFVFDSIHTKELEPKTVPAAEQATEDQRLKLARRQFGVDFFAGLLHFTLFSAWSLTIETHHVGPSTDPMPSAFAFQGILLFILFYDVFWLAARPRPYPRHLKFWTTINVLTAGAWLLSYHIALQNKWSVTDAEVPGLIIVGLVSVIDITQLTMGTQFVSTAIIVFARWLLRLVIDDSQKHK